MKKNVLYLGIAVMLLIIPAGNFAQAPDLGASSSFAIFTAIGEFNNTGTETYVTGDVGTNSGAFNAFPPGTLDGNIYLPGGATAEQAEIDVATAYSDLKANSCETTLISPIGSGQVLTPGVYCLGEATTLTGDLTLDGQGDPDALFIIKIDGAFLSTSTNANVILTNSATECNLYWQINGAFELGSYSTFRGTVIASGAISLYEGSELLGRALTTAGAVNINTTTAKLTCPDVSLPIELLYFNGSNKQFYNQLYWSTLTETNNDYFTLQKSEDTENFTEVARIDGSGNSNTEHLYSVRDYNLNAGITYYRLDQTDFNGVNTSSDLIAVFSEKPDDSFNIYPNPFRNVINIRSDDLSRKRNVEFKLYNITGTEILNTILLENFSTLEIPYAASGIYFYEISCQDKTIQTGKIVSQQ